MNTIDPTLGDNLYDTLAAAVAQAPCRFTFNEWEFETRIGETLGDARQRFKDEHGFEVLTNEELAAQTQQYMDALKAKQSADIAAAKVPTEADMQEAESPHPKTIEQLTAYVQSLVDRPHDYGTCVYAMSYAAVAAFNFVASKLGVTGFQASCADMDILRQTRGWKWGRILDYDNLLYPQYCNDERFPSATVLIHDPKVRGQLREKAQKLLAEKPKAHPDVIAHWRMLVE
jgi:hypothetical protein